MLCVNILVIVAWYNIDAAFYIGPVATWCCAWNPVLPRCSIGTEKAGLLLDVDRRYLWEYITGECVFAQKFSSVRIKKFVIASNR